MVFIEGNANLRPWSASARKFLLLIKNCLKSNKIMWGSSFAAQALIYLISTNIEKPVEVINGTSGSNYEDLKDMDIPDSVEHNQLHLFLDNITGDFYHFNQEQKQWLPYANVGMHSRKAAQEHPIPGKIIVNPTVERANALPKEIYQIYEGQNTECICYLKKQYVSHYLLIGIDSQFLVPTKNQWDIHSIKFPNPNLTFQILADSKFNCQIIEINEYTMATLFNISNKYPQTVKILKNFILHQLRNIKNGSSYIPIKKSSIKMLDGREIAEGLNIYLKHDTKTSSNPQINCFRKDELYISTLIDPSKLLHQSQYKLQQQQQKQQQAPTSSEQNDIKTAFNFNSRPSSPFTPINYLGEDNHTDKFISNTNKNNIIVTNKSNFISKNLQRPLTAATKLTSNKFRPMTAMTAVSSQFRSFSSVNINNELVKQQKMLNINSMNKKNQVEKEEQKPNVLIQNNIEQYEECLEDQKVQKNKTEIRLLLHPKLSSELQQNEELLWIPGILSCRQLEISSKWQEHKSQNNKKPIRIPSAKTQYNYFINQYNKTLLQAEPNSTDVQSKKDLLSIDTEQPIINSPPVMKTRPLTATHKNITTVMQKKYEEYDLCRNQSIMTRGAPYMEAQKAQLRQEREQNKLNLGPKTFNTSVKADLNNLKLSGIEYTHPPSAHQFRDQNPEKWISKQNFMLHFPKKKI